MSHYSCYVNDMGDAGYYASVGNGYDFNRDRWCDTLDQCIEFANNWNCSVCELFSSISGHWYDLFWTYAYNGKRETAYFEVDSCIGDDFEQYLKDTHMPYRTEPDMVLRDGKKLDVFAVECTEYEEHILKVFLTDRKMIVCSY